MMETGKGYVWRVRVLVYTLSMVLAVCVVIFGNMSQNKHYGAFPLALFVAWIATSTFLACFCYRDAETKLHFLSKCWYYLLCTAIIIGFFASLGTIDPANVNLWVPISFNLGIFLAQSLSALYTRMVEHLMGWRSSHDGHSLIPDEEQGHQHDRPVMMTTLPAVVSIPDEHVSQ